MNKKHVLLVGLVLSVAVLATVYILFVRDKDVLAPAKGFDTVEETPLSEKDVEIRRETVVAELTKPWGIGFLPDEGLIFTERAGAIQLFRDGQKKQLLVPDNLDARGEGGLLDVVVDPTYETTNYVYVCYNTTNDVRVVRWQLQDDQLSDENAIITAMPTATSGRHSGCRIGFGPDGYLWVGTGDAADGTTPQDPESLGGKVLRVDRDGNGAPGNLSSPFDSRIYSYGHRNIQGLAFAQNASYIGVSAEHGPDRDDEINLLLRGNYGWNPVPGYNESVPMTDTDAYPDAISAVWSSGKPTVALSGATFVYGSQWSQFDGSLFAATLKAKKVLQFSVSDDGELTPVQELFGDEFGRIRSIKQAPSGDLYITTDNGDGKDTITRLSPQ